ncbi:MAG: ABC transporter ATP-binding protein [Candidatus Yanofskybacteria bacterium GW2011_GWA1_44_21]|nr:MAG: ABC transporter ATP-binding protein [Candidatus Yanofskybacteria bacterium GW2011_GWA1_44_21]
MNSDLIQYIQEAKVSGMSDGEIQAELLSVGWNHGDVRQAFLDNISPELENPPIEQSEKIEAVVSVRGLIKHYGSVRAVDGIDFEIPKGSILALLGPNGAGKTTLVRMLGTLITPDSGQALIGGHDVIKSPDDVRKIIGLTGQFSAVDMVLTGRENLVMIGRLCHLSKLEAENRARELLIRFGLSDAADRQVKTYSGGMMRRLDVAASIIAHPEVLFLDEPTTGLDPHGRIELWHIIKELVAKDVTVLLTTQYLDEADHLADQIVVIDKGKIIAKGTSQELKAQVGGDVLELHLTDHSQAHRAAAAIEALGIEKPRIEELEAHIFMPVRGGASVLADAIRRLDQARIDLADIVLRRPTLDDVFLKLTGHVAG